MIPGWLLCDEVADACCDVVTVALGLPAYTAKRAPKNPIEDDAFEEIVRQLFGSLLRATQGEERAAVQHVLDMIDFDWPGASAGERERRLGQIGAALGGVPKLVLPKIDKALATVGPQLVQQTKQGAASHYDLPIQGTFNLVDQKVIEAARKSQAHYIRDEYGKRIGLASAKARDIVAHGLERGLDRYAIAKELQPAMEAIGVNRSVGYYRMIASVFAARARAWGTIASFDEAGIEFMEWVSMLDEVTTDACRLLDGKIFPVGAAKAQHEKVADSTDPEAVVELQPWVQAGRNADGEQVLYYRSEGKRVLVAKVERSGIGTTNDRGSFSGAMSIDGLVKAGITSPPAHAHCRSQFVPASATPSQVQVPAAAPVAARPGAGLLPSVQPYKGGKTPASDDDFLHSTNLPPPKAPPNLSALARPTRTVPAGFNPEALPELTAAEVAALEAAQAKQKALADALAKLAALPKTSTNAAVSPLPTVASLGPTWTSPKPNKVQIAGGKKKKPVSVLVDEVHGLDTFLGSKAKLAVEQFDPSAPVLLVKQGGVLTPADPAENYKLLAAKLHGQVAVQGKIIDLDKLAAKKPKAPVPTPPVPAPAATPVVVAPPVPAPPPVPTPPLAAVPPKGSAANILHQQVGQAKGSNEGGFYKGADGIDRYVKFYDELGKAECEHLANALYRDLGHIAPDSVLFEHKGKTAFASVILPNAKTLRDVGHSPERSKKILEGFVADVLVANWDVVGVGNNGGDDNVVFLSDGRVARIDNGGSFLMKGLTGRKPSAALNAISEWEKFLDPSVNFNYARMAKTAGVTRAEDMKDVVVDGIQKVLALEKAAGGWAAYVDKHVSGLASSDKARISEMLTARARLLEQRLAELTKPAPASGTPRFLAQQYSTVLPRVGLKISDLPETTAIEDHHKRIDRYNPERMPSGEKYSEYRKRAVDAVKSIKGEELRAIQDFTSSGYDAIRASEENGKPNSRSDAIQRALQRGTPEPGTVWRGICGLPETVIQKHLENGVLQLGKAGGSTTSTAWCIDVSVDTFMGGPEDSYQGSYKILYKLHGKTGVPVSAISSSGEHEHEVMFGREAAFRVTGLSRPRGRQRILIVEAEELVGAERDLALATSAPPPRSHTAHANPSSTPEAKDDALMKLALMPKAGAGKIVNPVAAVGGKASYFTSANPPPVQPLSVSLEKIKTAVASPTQLVSPSSITLHAKEIDAKLVKNFVENPLQPDAALKAVKAGGKIYMLAPSSDAVVAAYHLLDKEVPLKIIDAD